MIINTALFTTSCSNTKNNTNTTTNSPQVTDNKSTINKEFVNYASIGDSITWQDSNIYKETNEKSIGYQSILKNRFSIKEVYNLGVSGASLGMNNYYPKKKCVVTDLDYPLLKDCDLITIMIGTNDFRYGVPIGSIDELADNTFLGAYQLLINTIRNENPNAHIYLITPLQRNKDGYDINTINDCGNKLIDYVNATKSIGKKYSLPVVDIYNNFTINSSNLDKYTRDGLHPNDEGYKIIADYLYNFISQN